MQKKPKKRQAVHLALPLEVPPVLSVKPFSGSASGLSVPGGPSPCPVCESKASPKVSRVGTSGVAFDVSQGS